MTSHTGSMSPGDRPWRFFLWEWCWLPYVVGPTLWLYSLLIHYAREAPRLAGTNRSAAVALVALAVIPPTFWMAAYSIARRAWERRVCAVLYTTALTFPIVWVCLFALVGIGW